MYVGLLLYGVNNGADSPGGQPDSSDAHDYRNNDEFFASTPYFLSTAQRNGEAILPHATGDPDFVLLGSSMLHLCPDD